MIVLVFANRIPFFCRRVTVRFIHNTQVLRERTVGCLNRLYRGSNTNEHRYSWLNEYPVNSPHFFTQKIPPYVVRDSVNPPGLCLCAACLAPNVKFSLVNTSVQASVVVYLDHVHSLHQTPHHGNFHNIRIYCFLSTCASPTHGTLEHSQNNLAFFTRDLCIFNSTYSLHTSTSINSCCTQSDHFRLNYLDVTV